MAVATADETLTLPQAPSGVATLQHVLLWSIGAGGAIVFKEPSPYEIAIVASMVFFFATGLRMRLAFLPLMLLMLLINFGYTICASQLMDRPEIVNWIVTSWYMAATVVFLALLLSEDTAVRIDLVRRGLIFGAVIAAGSGVAGYFHLVPGGYDLLTLYSRARGTFKDPNVLGAFLVLPALFVLQDVITASLGKAFRSAIVFGLLSLAILLAFSRAAWGQLIFTAGFMIVTMFLTSPSRKQRSRIVTMSIAAVVLAVVLMLVLLSFDSIGQLFKERASFEQQYDSGRFGRFGRHLLGAQMALDLPLGIGPLQFHNYFPEDTHNSFLNAFMSGGWISGICYPALMFMTVALGFKYLFVKVPWQRHYLAIFAAFLGTVGENFIIDTDHWRHFWLMLGAMWAMFVAASRFRADERSSNIAPNENGPARSEAVQFR